MKALILAAGYATRLYPLTHKIPKPLLEISSRPILDYLLDDLTGYEGLDGIYLVTNHKFYGHFLKWRERHASREIRLIDDGTIDESDRLGAIGDIHLAMSRYKIEEDLLIVAGDNLFEFNLRQFIQFALNSRPALSVGVFDIEDIAQAKRFGVVEIDGGCRVSSFQEKPDAPRTTLIATGIYFFPREKHHLVETYLKKGGKPDAPGYYIKWLSEQETICGYRFSGRWFDIGDLDTYYKANQYFQMRKTGTHPSWGVSLKRGA